jgi:hypothetical protein
VAATNVSILCFYRRIFLTPTFLHISLILIIFNIIWFIPGMLGQIFVCTPVQSFWDAGIHGTCVYYSTFWIVIMAAELVIDVAILTLPIHETAKLQLSWRKKALLCMTFLLGGL